MAWILQPLAASKARRRAAKSQIAKLKSQRNLKSQISTPQGVARGPSEFVRKRTTYTFGEPVARRSFDPDPHDLPSDVHDFLGGKRPAPKNHPSCRSAADQRHQARESHGFTECLPPSGLQTPDSGPMCFRNRELRWIPGECSQENNSLEDGRMRRRSRSQDALTTERRRHKDPRRSRPRAFVLLRGLAHWTSAATRA
jgi:hypothetical protein